MFHGSIPPAAQAIVVEVARSWECSDIYVGCSGNFTVERALHTLHRFQLHGNDVSLYSGAIGAMLADAPFPVSIAEKYREDLAWLAPYVTNAVDTAATIMLSTRFAFAMDKTGPYYARLLDATRSNWPALHEKTAKKLRALTVKLASYANEDVFTWLDRVPGDAGLVTYPPFYANDYASGFAKLEAMFEWPRPHFGELDDARRAEFIEKVTARRDWVFGSNQQLPELADRLIGMTRTTNRGVPIHIYAGSGEARLTRPRQQTEEVPMRRLMPGDQLGERLRILPLSYPQFCLLRSKYMNEHIRPGQATQSFAVAVDDTLIGAYALSAAPSHAHYAADLSPHSYLLSDFPVAPTSYSRLAKLVLYAALSREAQLLGERYAHKRLRGLVTTAFTDRPVSMKYRGLFRLLKRTQLPQRVSGGTMQLQYGAPLGTWTLAEGYAEWREKHGVTE